MTAHVLLVSAYHGGSHAVWAEGLRRHSRHRITPVTHEAQAWTWRLTGGFVTLAEEARAAMAEHGPVDIVLATSMVDVAGLIGLLRRDLQGVPVALYMHENQITQPNLGRAKVRREHGLVSWTSLVAADGIAWNSEYHRKAVLDALPGFLRWYPDRRHDHLVPRVRDRSTVIPVGIDLARLDPPAPATDEPPLVLWSHRWDGDKDPRAALDALVTLAGEGLEFRVALAGERFVGQRRDLDDLVAALGDRVVADGFLDEPEYRDVVRAADVVLSTAHHEFFGISVAEAMYAGAVPIVPEGLVYPERVPEDLQGVCLYPGPDGMLNRLRRVLTDRALRAAVAPSLTAAVARFDWSVVGPQTDDWIDSLIDC